MWKDGVRGRRAVLGQFKFQLLTPDQTWRGHSRADIIDPERAWRGLKSKGIFSLLFVCSFQINCIRIVLLTLEKSEGTYSDGVQNTNGTDQVLG
jgi:hypothetical protein